MVYYFVYGTLRSEHRNSFLMSENGATLMGPATLEHHVIISLGGFPGLLVGEGTVVGELWQSAKDVEEFLLRRLDHYEGCENGDDENSFYVRKKVQAKHNDVLYEANAYLYHNFGKEITHPRIVKSGDWFNKT